MDKSIAVIGAGYWGKNLVRNFAELGLLHTVCDTVVENLLRVTDTYQSVNTTHNLDDVLANPDIKGIVFATPAETHFQFAKQALLAGKDVFVEKPLALSVSQGEELVSLAAKHGRMLMVGHVLQYHPAILKLKALISSGALGRLQYIYSNRLNFGKIRREENILWSFAPHDISVILELVGSMPEEISATGSNYLHQDIADTTMSQMKFSNGVSAHIFVSWLHPFKEQKLVVVGDKQMAVFDDTLSWEQKLTLYHHEIEWLNNVPQAKKGTGTPVELEQAEPLKQECLAFYESIESRAAAKTSGAEGLNVLKVLDGLQQSLDNHGRWRQFSQTNHYFSHPTAEIHQQTSIGSGTKIWHFSHIMSNTTIGNSCSFGQNCVVGPNVVIGNGVKVQNNISIYDGVEIEDDVFLGPSMVFTNVTNPRSFIVRKTEFKKTLLKQGSSVGANATIVCGTTLGEYSFVAAGAVITKDVKPFALMAGVPAKQIGWVSRAGNRLHLDKNGYAKDDFDGSEYQLDGDELMMTSQQQVNV